MGNKAVKVHKKAQAIKGGAVGAFTTAITKVNEANGLLDKANSLDMAEVDKLTMQIEALCDKRLELRDNVTRRNAEIEGNLALIERLQQFA